MLCLGAGREQKETAMDARQEEHFLDALTRLQTSVSKANIVLTAKVGERVGRIVERFPRLRAGDADWLLCH